MNELQKAEVVALLMSYRDSLPHNPKRKYVESIIEQLAGVNVNE